MLMKVDKEIIEKIKSLPTPKIITLSGLGGSGKSSIAKELGVALDAQVVGIDAFQRKGAFDTAYSLWNIMDYTRLEEEVLKPFLDKQNIIRYGHFDAKTELISEIVEFKNNGTLIVEGVGVFRPELIKYFIYKIWINVPMEEAIARGKKRDREEYHNPTDDLWDGVWKDNDLQYLETYKPQQMADLVISNS